MSSTPAGWYPDGQGGQRWWDGSQWTEHTLPAEPAAQPEPQSPADPHDAPTQLRAPGAGPLDGGSGSSPSGAPQSGAPQSAQPQQPGGYPSQGASQGYGQQSGGYPSQSGGYPAQGGGYPQQGGYPAQGGYPQQGGYPGQGGGYPGAAGGQGGQGAPKKGLSGKLIGLVGGGVAAVVIVIVLLVVLLGGGGGPGATVESYFDAIQDGDCGFVDYVSEGNADNFDKEECEDDPEEYIGSNDDCADSDLEIVDEKEDGDTATVDYEVTGGGEDCESEGTFELVKEDGDWKIDDAA